MATIRDIARQLGISPGTVSKGLNGASDISESTRQAVLDAAVELGYKPKSMQGRSLRKICILVENMNYENVDQFGYEIIAGFEQSAALKGCQVDIVPAGLSIQTGEPYDTFMLKNKYSGAFLLGFELHNDYLRQLHDTKVPSVLLDNFIEDNPRVGYVGTDNFEGMKHIVNHLAALGHKEIAILCGSPDSLITVRRFDAFKHFMWCNQLKWRDELIAYGDFNRDTAPQHVPHFLEHGATAIVCGSDYIASGVIRALSSLGIRVPEDVSVTGFDDLPLARYLTPPLTTVRQNRLDLGKSAFLLLDGLMHGVCISRLELRPSFIPRQSTCLVSSSSSSR